MFGWLSKKPLGCDLTVSASWPSSFEQVARFLHKHQDDIVPVSRMDEVLARAMTRKPEPIEWDETAAAAPEEAPVEEEASTLTAH